MMNRNKWKILKTFIYDKKKYQPDTNSSLGSCSLALWTAMARAIQNTLSATLHSLIPAPYSKPPAPERNTVPLMTGAFLALRLVNGTVRQHLSRQDSSAENQII